MNSWLLNSSHRIQVPMGSEPGTSGTMHVPESYDPGEDLMSEDPMSPGIMATPLIRSDVKFDQCYEICTHMEDGKFGKVYMVRNKSTNKEFAAKFIKIKKLADKEGVEKEVSILCSLRHPKIAQIYDAFYTVNNEVVLIMEIVRGGELFKRVADDNYVLTEQAVAIIIWQLCEAIEFIHSQHIIHLDLKPENIMCVSETGNKIKLIDFGLAQFYDGSKEVKYLACTPEFGAPEVITFENLSFHTDMWSVGVITYLLLSGYSPFLGENDAETYTNVEKAVWEFTEEFDAFTPESKDFISKLLIKNPKERMLPAACLAHPWITQHRAKALAAANSTKPVAEGAKIDNRLMRRYNARRKFREAGYKVRFLISMLGIRKSLQARKSENGLKYFEPIIKMAEEREKKLTMIANALSSRPPAPLPLGEFMGPLPVSLSKKRASLATDSHGNVVLGKQEKEEKVVKMFKEKSALPPKIPANPSKPLEEGVKIITKTVVDPVTGEVKTVKKKSIKKKKEPVVEKTAETSIGTPTKNNSVSLETAEANMKKLSLVHADSAPVAPATNVAVAKKKSLPIDLNTVLTSSAQKQRLASSDGLSSESSSTRKSVTFEKSATDKKSSITSESSVQPPLKKISLSSEIPETPKKKKTVVLVEPPPTPQVAETKGESLLSILKKRKSLPTEIPLSISEEKKEILRKQSLHTEMPAITTKSAETTPKKKLSVSKEAPVVEVKVHEQKEKHATVTEIPKKRKSLVAVSETVPLVPAKSENLIAPRMEKKVTKSESSDSHKENREQEEKKPTRQGAVKKKEKVDDSVLNLMTTRKSVDLSSSQSIATKDGEKTSETVIVRKKLSLTSTGEKDKVDEAKVEIKKDEKKTESLIKARLSKLNSEAPPLSFNIMSVAQKSFPTEEKKSATIISMTPEKLTTTTTSTTTSVKKKSSITEKKVQLSTAAGKTVEQVEKTNSTHDKLKVSQITTKKEESPELETPLTSVEKRVVKKNSLKALSEKQRKEEETTQNGTIVQISKVLNDKSLNHMAVSQQTTAPSGAVKKVSLTHTNEVNKKVEGKAEAEVTPKRTSLKKADITMTEKNKSTLGADVNGNKTVLQKTHKTEIKITPTFNGESLVKVEAPKNNVDKKRGSILTVPNLSHRDSSEERKTVRFVGDLKETLPPKSRSPMPGLKRMNSESALHKKVQSAVKVEEKVTQDDGAVKKQKRLLKSAKSEDVFIPKDEFSFHTLKETLLRRVSDASNNESMVVVPKECVSVAKTHSVKDRLRQFEKK